MAWIKRNLILVISGVVALVLFGLGGYYLYSANQKNQQIDTDIESTKSEIRRLLEKPVTPTAENLKLAKQEAVKLNTFVTDAKRLFPGTPAPAEALTSSSFKSLLANTVSELHRQAATVPTVLVTTNAGLPYYFTFDGQRLALNLPPESLRPLYERLHEVEFISQVLFKARINRLVSMKRAAVLGERPVGGNMAAGGGNDYLTAAARVDSETGMALWPYEVVFDCFTPELALALEGLQSAKYGLLVKSVEIRPTDETAPAPGIRPLPGQPPGGRTLPGQTPVRGRGPGPAPVRPAAPVAAAPGVPGLVTIINEQLIRVTLQLEVIKPDSSAGRGPGGPPPRGGRPGGAP